VAPEPRRAAAGDPELEQLIGSIRRRRLEQAARERAAGARGGAQQNVPDSGVAAGVRPGSALPPVSSASASGSPGSSAASARGGSAAASARGGSAVASARVASAVVSARAGSPGPSAVPGAAAEGGVVLDVRAVGERVSILRVARPSGFVFEAGQAIKVGLPGVPIRRSYSIASAPHEPHLELCIERVPGGRLSALLAGVSSGARLELAPKPKGSFTLQTGKLRHLMVATVTGIAPLRSMLRNALSQPGAAPEFWILHGASHADELPYADELAELERSEPRVHYLPTVSRPGDLKNRGWTGRAGRVETHVLSTLHALGGRDVAVYACGHPEMVGNVQSLLRPLGYDVSSEDFG
jgi:NAD(P)H-flavin reductase